MVDIQPVVFPIVGTATKLGISILGFTTDAKTCTVYYALMTDKTERIIEGNYQLTEDEFAAWGVDNNYINEVVANYLKVIIVPTTTTTTTLSTTTTVNQ
jgi:hypothetical protein